MFLKNCVLTLNWIVLNRTICIKIDLALNNLQRLICHKAQPTNQPSKSDLGVIILIINNLQLYHFKCSYRMWIFFKQNNLIIGEALTCITTPDQSGLETYGNEGLPLHSPSLHELEPFHKCCLLSYPIYSFHVLPLCRRGGGAVSVFYALPTEQKLSKLKRWKNKWIAS